MYITDQVSSCRNCGDQLRSALEIQPKGTPGKLFRRLTARVKCVNCDQDALGRNVDQAIELWNHQQKGETV